MIPAIPTPPDFTEGEPGMSADELIALKAQLDKELTRNCWLRDILEPSCEAVGDDMVSLIDPDVLTTLDMMIDVDQNTLYPLKRQADVA